MIAANAHAHAQTRPPTPAAAPTPDARPAVAYLRRSTDKQEQSIGDQRKEVLRWAEQNGYRVVAEYVDDAISATSARSRLAFQRMVADAERGTFTAVIVWNSDRFSRGDVSETEHYRYVLREAGVTVLSVTEDYLAREGIDGDVLRTVKQFQNRQFSISLSQNTLRGQISAVLGASDPGRMTPYGYDREVVGPEGAVLYRVRFLPGGDRELRSTEGAVQAVYRKGHTLRKPGKECSARLVLSDSERVNAVRDIFRWCVEGWGFRRIAEELNRRGIVSPRGRLWQHTSVKALIENPVYRGDVVWNRRTQSKFFEVRSARAEAMKPQARAGRVQPVPQDHWIVIENAVPAIVDRATWDKAQTAATARADCSNGTGKQVDRWLLSGVMRCACCGHPYWGIKKRKGKDYGKTQVVKAYYICAGRTRCGKTVCAVSAHVPADALEKWVLDQVREAVLGDAAGVQEAIERFVSAVQQHHGNRTDAASIKRELATIEKTINALLTGLDPANLVLANDRLTQLRRKRERLQKQLRESQSSTIDEQALRRWATERLELLTEMIAGRRDEKARQALASYVEEILIEPATKSGVLRLNAGLPARPATRPASGPSTGDEASGSSPCGDRQRHPASPTEPATRPQNDDDRPAKGGRSHATAIAGAGFEPATSGL